MSLLLIALAAFAAPWTPAPAEAQAVRALSVRDPAPTCAAVVAQLDTPVASLTAIVEHVEIPPWAGMRAAACLTEQGEAAEASLQAWLERRDRAGAAGLLLHHLDSLPQAMAGRLARRALAGPHAELAKRSLLASSRPELVRLAESR